MRSFYLILEGEIAALNIKPVSGQGSIPSQSRNKMASKIFLLIVLVAFASSVRSSYVRELRVFTSSCNECGMTALGEISIKVIPFGTTRLG